LWRGGDGGLGHVMGDWGRNNGKRRVTARVKVTTKLEKSSLVPWTIGTRASYIKPILLKNGVKFLDLGGREDSGMGQIGCKGILPVPTALAGFRKTVFIPAIGYDNIEDVGHSNLFEKRDMEMLNGVDSIRIRFG
jgi:hypothetical protein